MAVGLGSMDMPVPSVEEWEWLNWKFPRPVHAGDTIFARWTLTQKRPPIGAAPSAVVVWRVDVHTTDGALCAEGEVGAKVRRDSGARARAEIPSAVAAAGSSGQAPAGAPRRRRRRRAPNGTATMPEPPAVAAPPASMAKPERAAGPSRRRRRRRPSGQGARTEEHEPRAAHAPDAIPPPVNSPPPATAPTKTKGGLGNVIRRLRGSSPQG
jgi:hypothetical protein